MAYQLVLRASRAKTPRFRSYGTDWELANPHCAEAHLVVSQARRLGWLTPQPCRVCGAAKVEAHHSDYSKPLLITWLCRKCHRRRHASERRSA